jgi:hypothetical protein
MVNRAATAVASITPDRRRGVFGMWYRMMLLPVRVPLALVLQRTARRVAATSIGV